MSRRWAAVMVVLAVLVALPGSAVTAATTHRAAFPGVTILPPVGNAPIPSGAFDPSVDLRIEIFALASDSAVGLPVGPSFSVSPSAGQRIKVNDPTGPDAHYHASWKSSDSRQLDGSTVRVELRLPAAPSGPACNAGVGLASGCLGYFDVALKGKKGGSWPDGVMVLTNGQTLPIRVHIARGALEPPPSGASQLPGPPGAAATEAIPDLDFEFSPDDYLPHPDLGGLMVTFDTLLLSFKLDTTVANANALLADIDGQIVGGVPGGAGQAEGALVLRVPTGTHAEMDALIARLGADARVSIAVQDSLLEADEVPSPTPDAIPGGWTWEVAPTGGNWGLEAIRAPQLWNLNRAVVKTGRTAITGVLDGGFASHPDLAYALNLSSGPSADPEHGTHVSGTIAAFYNNKKGVDGVNPFADLVVKPYSLAAGGIGSWGLFDFLEQVPQLQVVNLSLGNKWAAKAQDPAFNTTAQDLIRRQARMFETRQALLLFKGRRLPLLVGSAGNDSAKPTLFNVTVDARWNAPWAYAALVDGVENVIMVEAARLDAGGGMSRAPFSNINGHVSAPGAAIVSTAPPGTNPVPYIAMSGTSMAAPHVTGLASYLLSLDPTLTPVEIRGLLRSTATPTVADGSALVDAYASALAIDGLRGNSAVLKRLLDIDDGTTDGNLRLLCGATCTAFPAEDADGDGGQGDGVIDMSDFRRWRDWILITEGSPALSLDGAGQLKHDVNGNQVLEFAADENVFPRGDFNGDGELDRNAVRYVPGRVNAPVTDLQALQALFEDDRYSSSQLPALINSADIHVDPAGCLTSPGAVSVRTTIIEAATSNPVDDSESSAASLFTVPVKTGGYIVRVEARDLGGTVVGVAQNSFAATLGSDSWYAPTTCGRIVLTPTQLNVAMNAGETTSRSVKLVSAGLAADWTFASSVANVEPSPAGGSISAGGETQIDLTISCPENPGGYGGILGLEFRDAAGQVIESGVPESLAVDIVCLEGGVTVEPESFSLTLPVGSSASRTLRLTNKGTELTYEAQPGAHLSIEEGAAGVLATRNGQAFVTVVATCPENAGSYSTSVGLRFEQPDGKPVTVEVPSEVPVNLDCTGALKIVRQEHVTQVGFPPFDDKSEAYVSEDALGTAWVRRLWSAGQPTGEPIVVSDVTTPIDPIGFGDISSATELTVSSERPGWWPGVRTVFGRSLLTYSSDFDGTTATFSTNFSHDYSQSRDPFLAEPRDFVGGRTQLTFDLDVAARLVVSWSCDGQFGNPNVAGPSIRLLRSGVSIFESSADQRTGCVFDGILSPGRYDFRAGSALILGVNFDQRELSATRNASYTMTLTFP